MIDAPDPTSRIRDAALALGFARVGITPAVPFRDARDRLDEWLAAGHHGELAYLTTGDDRADPRALLPEARSVIVAALPYPGGGPAVALRRSRDAAEPLRGSIARYARGADYHHVLKTKLYELARACRDVVGRAVAFRACVDTAPLLEREAAKRAGVGFTGKSTMTIAPGLGTYFLLGELLIDIDLEPSAEVRAGCGRCTACLDACPTRAFVGPYVLDAKRCVSYLTIETRGEIPRALRPLIGDRVFGCDVCQDVCPFNGSDAPRPAAPELSPREHLEAPSLVDLLEIGSAAYRRLVRRSALRRIGKQQLQRNAAVALGNSGDPRAVEPLARCLKTDRSALVRAHVAWALGRFSSLPSRSALEECLRSESDATVLAEARAALEFMSRAPSEP